MFKEPTKNVVRGVYNVTTILNGSAHTDTMESFKTVDDVLQNLSETASLEYAMEVAMWLGSVNPQQSSSVDVASGAGFDRWEYTPE